VVFTVISVRVRPVFLAFDAHSSADGHSVSGNMFPPSSMLRTKNLKLEDIRVLRYHQIGNVTSQKQSM
jgi:hypothetical protein